MAKYTVTIKSLIDNNFDFQLTEYPIFDEKYRNTLNNKILNHYYNSEIGFETAALFRFYLKNKMLEIMPYYNELYKAQASILKNNNILDNVNLTETLERQNNTSTSSSSSSTSNSSGETNAKNLFQDTPQGKISQASIDAQEWATNYTLDKNQNTSTINDNSNSKGAADTTENYVKKIVGSNGAKYSTEVLNDIKNNILNIDMLIINDLNELFMGIY